MLRITQPVTVRDATGFTTDKNNKTANKVGN